MTRPTSNGSVWLALLALIPLLVLPHGWAGDCSTLRADCCRAELEFAAPVSDCCPAEANDLGQVPLAPSPCQCAHAAELPPALPFGGDVSDAASLARPPAHAGPGEPRRWVTIGFTAQPTPRAGAPAHLLNCVFLI